MAGKDSYSGWLGGYAKSVAGSVTAFTQDILEETRQDPQDVGSLLKVSNEKVVECEAKIQSLEHEVKKLKSELLESNENKEVTELQLQEVGDRWRLILREKDDEFKALKEKLQAIESERETDQAETRRTHKLSGDIIDFSDPFLCEMEIGRLSSENQRLLTQLNELSYKARTSDSTGEGNDSNQNKILALQAQLRSVYIEHQNELAVKDQEIHRSVANVREECERVVQSSHIDCSLSEDGPDLQQKLSELQYQMKREQGFFKQLEQEKSTLAEQLHDSNTNISQLESWNSDLETRVTELAGVEERSKEEIGGLQEKIRGLEQAVLRNQDNETTLSQHAEQRGELQAIIEARTIQLAQLKSKHAETAMLLSNRDKEIHQLRIALNTVQSEDFQELRGLVDSLKIQVDGYKDTLKETGHKLLHSNTRIETLSKQEVELTATVRYLEEEKVKLFEQAQMLNLQNKTKEDFISELQSTCSTSRCSLAQLTEELEVLKTDHQTAVKLCNQLKAEKLELMVDSKKHKEENDFLRQENKKLAAKQAQLKQKTLFYLLEEDISENQILDIKDIVSPDSQTEASDGTSPARRRVAEKAEAEDARELKRKLADKSEQLRLLQGTISKFKSEKEEQLCKTDHEAILANLHTQHETVVAGLQIKIDELEEWMSNVLQEQQVLKDSNTALEAAIKEREQETKSSASDELVGQKLQDLQKSADKERTRLLSEIERLVGETAEIEEVYTATVVDKEKLEQELGALKETIKASASERDVLETKLGKASENLKKALARLAVKDAKIDELSDQLGVVETKLAEANEQVDFFKSNQTDEIKAAQLGLSTTTPAIPPIGTDDTVQTLYRQTDTDDTVQTLYRQVDALKQKMGESEGKYFKLQEECRDKELKIDLLLAEVASTAESSLSETETNKLIDQNMSLQKKTSTVERDLESVKKQNLELIHQRDFYQEQASKFHDSMENLRTEANKLINDANEREKKTGTELDRLKNELVKSEQVHTEDYLLATRSEQDLREEVGRLREEILTANSTLDGARSDNSTEVSNLTEQLHVISTQRDEALLQASVVEDQAASFQTALTNLQIVLEQFQQDREGYASEIQYQYKRDLEVLTTRLKEADATIAQLEARVSEIRVIEEDFKLCKEDVRSKDDRIKTLQREVSKLDVALKVAQEGLQKVRNTSEDKVERSLIKTFFTQYLTAPDTRKPEVLRLMTSILNYSEEELEHLQRSKDKKWLTQLFKPVQNSTELPPGESFSELFVSFLETEANRGTILGSSRPASTPPLQPTHQPTHQRSPSAASNPQQRSPSSASNHKRSSSSASSKSLPVGGTIEVVSFPNTPSAISGAQSTPLVVPASLADLLVSKPR